jgi:hypothetical protein
LAVDEKTDGSGPNGNKHYQNSIKPLTFSKRGLVDVYVHRKTKMRSKVLNFQHHEHYSISVRRGPSWNCSHVTSVALRGPGALVAGKLAYERDEAIISERDQQCFKTLMGY